MIARTPKHELTFDDFLQDEDSGALSKVLSGRLGEFDTADYLEAGSVVTGALPGIGQAGSVILTNAAGKAGAAKTEDRLNADLGEDIRRVRGERAVTEAVNELDSRSTHATAQAVLGAGAFAGGWAAGAAGQALIPIPGLGWIAGMTTGAAADRFYDYLFKSVDHKAALLAAKMQKAQNAGVAIPEEAVFATIVARLSEKEGKFIRDKLEKATGTRSAYEALAQGKYDELRVLMQSENVDNTLRGLTPMGLFIDPKHPEKTITAQYAEAINHGFKDVDGKMRKLPAKDLLIAKDQIHILQAMCLNCNESNPSAVLPPQSQSDISSVAMALNRQGVTPTLGEDGQLQLLPLNTNNQHGKV